MNPNRIHKRESFYKYTTVAAAKNILSNSELRWSSPSLFNDPFDIPQEICNGINEQNIQEAMLDRLNELVMHPELPHPEHYSVMTRVLLFGFSRSDVELKKKLIEANNQSRNDARLTSEGLEMLREKWRSVYGTQRILCLTEVWNSASMWDRYANGNRGILLQFGCHDDLDSAWLLAKQVLYTDAPLKANTPKGFAELMLYTPLYATERIMEEYTHTKTTDWAYEKEWRIASWKRPYESGEYSDYKFLPEELHSITFGIATSQTEKMEFRELLKAKYPHAQLWQAVMNGGRRLERIELPR